MSVQESDPPDEWSRLSTARSIADMIAHHVDRLEPVPCETLPIWLTTISPPIGWRIGHLKDYRNTPSRIAVHGFGALDHEYGCETISLFQFDGFPPHRILLDNAACTLHDLRATGIATRVLPPQPNLDITGVRSSGYVNTREMSIWAQYSSYMTGAKLPGKGMLVQHGIFVQSTALDRLRRDITYLTNIVFNGFSTATPEAGLLPDGKSQQSRNTDV